MENNWGAIQTFQSAGAAAAPPRVLQKCHKTHLQLQYSSVGRAVGKACAGRLPIHSDLGLPDGRQERRQEVGRGVFLGSGKGGMGADWVWEGEGLAEQASTESPPQAFLHYTWPLGLPPAK